MTIEEWPSKVISEVKEMHEKEVMTEPLPVPETPPVVKTIELE